VLVLGAPAVVPPQLQGAAQGCLGELLGGTAESASAGLAAAGPASAARQGSAARKPPPQQEDPQGAAEVPPSFLHQRQHQSNCARGAQRLGGLREGSLSWLPALLVGVRARLRVPAS